MKTINFIKKMHVFILVFAVLYVFNSCENASEKTSETFIESVIDNDTNVDLEDEKIVMKTEKGTFTTDATKHSWPDEIPNNVPEFLDGKIVNVSTRELGLSKNWNLLFEELGEKALSDYETKLIENGFKVSCITIGGTNVQITGENNDLIVVVMGGEGMASLSVGVGD